MLNRSRVIRTIMGLGLLGSMLTASPALAAGGGRGGLNGTDIQTFSGSVSVSAPATVAFTTMPNENAVILSLQARSGGDRWVTVYDPAGTVVAQFVVPAAATGLWSNTIDVLPSTTYRAVITVTSGSTKYTFYVNHCPDGKCF